MFCGAGMQLWQLNVFVWLMTKGVTCVPKFPLHSVSVQISLNRVGVHEKIVRLHIKITFVHNGKAKMK